MEKRNVIDPESADLAKQAEADAEEIAQVKLFGGCCGQRGTGDCDCREKPCASATTSRVS